MKYAKPILALCALVTFANAADAAVFTSNSPVIMNGSFETPATSNFIYNPTVSGVTFNAGSGVQHNGTWLFPDAPDGVQTAFIQSSHSYIGAITFALSNLSIGQAYSVSFSASARPDPGNDDYASNPFTVALNGATLGSYDTKVTSWRSFTTNSFVATGTTASLSFTGSPTTTGDNDVGIDNVKIAAVPEPATWAMMLLGFGGIGASMRRRRQPARIRFA